MWGECYACHPEQSQWSGHISSWMSSEALWGMKASMSIGNGIVLHNPMRESLIRHCFSHMRSRPRHKQLVKIPESKPLFLWWKRRRMKSLQFNSATLVRQNVCWDKASNTINRYQRRKGLDTTSFLQGPFMKLLIRGCCPADLFPQNNMKYWSSCQLHLYGWQSLPFINQIMYETQQINHWTLKRECVPLPLLKNTPLTKVKWASKKFSILNSI